MWCRGVMCVGTAGRLVIREDTDAEGHGEYYCEYHQQAVG